MNPNAGSPPSNPPDIPLMRDETSQKEHLSPYIVPDEYFRDLSTPILPTLWNYSELFADILCHDFGSQTSDDDTYAKLDVDWEDILEAALVISLLFEKPTKPVDDHALFSFIDLDDFLPLADIHRLENENDDNKQLLESLELQLADFAQSMDTISRSLNGHSHVNSSTLREQPQPGVDAANTGTTLADEDNAARNDDESNPDDYAIEPPSPTSGSCSPTAATPFSTFSETCSTPGTSYTSEPASPVTSAIKSLADSTTTTPSSPTKSSASIDSPLVSLASCDDGNERNDFHSAVN